MLVIFPGCCMLNRSRYTEDGYTWNTMSDMWLESRMVFVFLVRVRTKGRVFWGETP